MANETLVQEKQQVQERLESPPLASKTTSTAAEIKSVMDGLSQDGEGSSTQRHPTVQTVLAGLLWVAYTALAIGVLMLIWSTGKALSRSLPR